MKRNAARKRGGAIRLALACAVTLGLVPIGAFASPDSPNVFAGVSDTGVPSARSAESGDEMRSGAQPAHAAGIAANDGEAASDAESAEELGQTPSETPADIDAAEALRQSNCVIAKALDAGALADEPVACDLGDAVLLSYATPEEADEALQRLAGECEFVEADSPVEAATPLEPTAAGVGSREAVGSIGHDSADAQRLSALVDDLGEASAQADSIEQGELASLEAAEGFEQGDARRSETEGDAAGSASGPVDGSFGGDASSAGVDVGSPIPAELGNGFGATDDTAQERDDSVLKKVQDNEISDAAEPVDGDGDGDGGSDGDGDGESNDGDDGACGSGSSEAAQASVGQDGHRGQGVRARRGQRPLVALVDSGAPEGAEVVRALSVIGDEVNDANGHAATMYEAIRALAPDSDVMTIRILDESGRGTVAALYAGVKMAMAQGADIINLSVCTQSGEESAAISAAIQEAREAGIVVVAAAGNAGMDAGKYVPANVPGVITAAACNAEGSRLASSNFGEAVDVYVPCSATSVAAATVSGWLAAHADLDDPLGSLQQACDEGLFFRDVDEPDAAEVEAGDTMEYDAVMPAMAITQPVKTELRNNAARSESAVPAQTIVLDNGGILPLAEAQLSGSVAGLERATHLISSGRIVNREAYGIWVTNPGTQGAAGNEREVDGTIQLKWTDVGADADGNRLDLTLDVSNIKIRTDDPIAQNASSPGSSKRILLFRNTGYSDGSGPLNLSCRMEAVDGKNSRMGACMTVHVTFHKTGEPTSAKAKGTYLFMSSDLDQPDSTLWAVSDYEYTGKYTESMQLVSGFDAQTYLQEDIPDSSSSPDPGSSLLRVNMAAGRFSAMAPNDYPGEFRAGFVAATSGAEFAVNWYGSGCDTELLSNYEGVVIRDKNDPTNDTTDKAIITKTTNAYGQDLSNEEAPYDESSNHGGKRTSTSWRSTDMPWKGSGAYHFSAQDGYRVTKVQVLYKKWDKETQKEIDEGDVFEGEDLNGLTELTFGDGNADYPVVRDYDIIVTTACVPDAVATIKARKTLQGRALEAGEFAFELREGETLVGQAGNAADGTVTFLPLSYRYSDKKDYPIRHVYTMSEVAGEAAGMSYDTSTFAVNVTETYDSDAGVLKASVDYPEDPSFENVFSKHGGVRVRKVDASTDEGVEGAQFEVRAAEGGETYGLTSGEDGIAELDGGTLPEGAYEVREARAPEGYLLNETWKVAFTVEEDGVVVDLTGDPCRDEPDRLVTMPKTGGSGVTWMLTASVGAVAAGVMVRRRLAAH